MKSGEITPAEVRYNLFMRRSTLTLVVIVMLAACGGRRLGSPKPEWKPYTGDHFTTEFPGPVTTGSAPMDIEFGETADMTILQTDVGGDRYYLGYADMTEARVAQIGSNLPRHASDAMLKAAHSERTGAAGAQLNGVDGQTVYGTSTESNDRAIETRVFAVGSRVYVIAASGTVNTTTMKPQYDEADHQHFFNSLKWN